MNTLKAFYMFWQPAPDTLMRILRLERAILERRRNAALRKQAMLRIRLAGITSALEQIEQEINGSEQ